MCFLSLVLTSCGKPQPLDISFTDVDSQKNYRSEDLSNLRLQGLSRLEANDPLTNFRDSLSLDLVFNFLDQDSSLNLVAYTNSMLTKTGTTLRFTINGKNLEVDVFLQDYPMFHLCHLENFITANQDVRLKVQFLNSQGFGPIISIWNQSSQFAEGRKRNLNALNVNTAECTTLNSTVPINMFGLGNLWGLELNKVKVKSVKRTETYVL